MWEAPHVTSCCFCERWKNVAAPFDSSQCLLHFLCLVFPAREEGVAGIPTTGEEEGREDGTESGSEEENKRTNPPLHFQLGWPTCFVLGVQRWLSGGTGSSVQTVCAQRLWHTDAAVSSALIYRNHWLHICSHLRNTFTHLTSAATPQRVWRFLT